MGPWEFHEAEAKHRAASEASKHTAQFVRDSFKTWAQKEEAYRLALALKIDELHSAGKSITLAKDLARGDRHVAHLKFEAMVAEGVVEAARQSAFAAQADRRAIEGLADWSKRRELAEMS